MISPDGRRIAYVGRSRIWVQSLGEWKPRELPDTEAATRPFWSPDGEWIAYFRSEALLKVPATGGPVVRVCDLPAVQAPLGGNSGVWSEDGTITVSMSAGPLLRVHSGGGRAEVSRPAAADRGARPARDRAAAERRHSRRRSSLRAAPTRSACSRTTRSTSCSRHRTSRFRRTGARRTDHARRGREFLLYQRTAPNPGLWAVRFSLERLETAGEPFLIGEGTDLSIARDGTVAFLGQLESLARQVAWFSWDGRAGARIGEPREWAEGLAISPDGRRVLAAALDGIWAYDVETGARSRITTDPERHHAGVARRRRPRVRAGSRGRAGVDEQESDARRRGDGDRHQSALPEGDRRRAPPHVQSWTWRTRAAGRSPGSTSTGPARSIASERRTSARASPPCRRTARWWPTSRARSARTRSS